MNKNPTTASLLLFCLFSGINQNSFAGFVDTVLIGNPGNAAIYIDPHDDRWYKSGYFGSVPYSYRIGTTEVTNDQYVTFLNAVASADPRSLFNPTMQSDPRGGIIRTGTSGSYSYTTKEFMGNKPVNYVSFWDTKRFANWLNNGMPSGSEDLSTTEDGAYYLGGITNPAKEDRDIPRNPDAKWWLPTEDEWFKAAYHKNDGVTGNYFEYPTATDEEPIEATADAFGNVSNPGNNVVNYNNGADWNGLNGNVTTVGSTGSPSAYGTFDQAGNLDEWNDTLIGCLSVADGGCYEGPGPLLTVIVRGGTWAQYNDFHIAGVQTGNRDLGGANGSNSIIGFRVATIVEDSADFNGDSLVDDLDLQLWQQAFGNTIAGDADNDGDTDGNDFLIWQRQYVTGDNLQPTSNEVPEPSSLVLTIAAMASFGMSRRSIKSVEIR